MVRRLLGLLLVSAFSWPLALSAGEGKHGFLPRVHKGADGDSKYVLFVPHDYKADKEAPLILFLHGAASANEARATNSIAAIEAAKDPAVNAHMRFCDTNAQGYGLMTVTADQITATLVTIERPISETGAAGVQIKSTATFTLDRDDVTSLAGPEFTGDPPFPFA